MHAGFHNGRDRVASGTRTSKPIISSKKLISMRGGGGLLQLMHKEQSGIGVQILGAQILILSILFFDDLQLVQQRLVADLQNSCGLPTIPARLV